MKKRVYISDRSAFSVDGSSNNLYRSYSIRSNTSENENVGRNFRYFVDNTSHLSRILVDRYAEAITNNLPVEVIQSDDFVEPHASAIFQEASRMSRQLARIPGHIGREILSSEDLDQWVVNDAVLTVRSVLDNAYLTAHALTGTNINFLFPLPPSDTAAAVLIAENAQEIDQEWVDQTATLPNSRTHINRMINHAAEELNNTRKPDRYAVGARSEFISDTMSVVYTDKSEEPSVLSSPKREWVRDWPPDSIFNSTTQSDANEHNATSRDAFSFPLSTSHSDSRFLSRNSSINLNIPGTITVDLAEQSFDDSSVSLQIPFINANSGLDSSNSLDDSAAYDADNEDYSSLFSLCSTDTNNTAF